MNAENWNCCGSGPHTPGEVRVLPYGGGGNLILCRACYHKEIRWRRDRNRKLEDFAQYDLPEWEDLNPYGME